MKNVSKMFFFLSPSLTFTFLGAHYLLPNIFCVMYRVLYRVGDDRSLSAMYAVALGFTIMVYTTKVFQTWKLIIIQVMTVIPATTVLLSLRKNMHLRNKLKLVLLQLSYEKKTVFLIPPMQQVPKIGSLNPYLYCQTLQSARTQEFKCTTCSPDGDTYMLEHYLLGWNRFSNKQTSAFLSRILLVVTHISVSQPDFS